MGNLSRAAIVYLGATLASACGTEPQPVPVYGGPGLESPPEAQETSQTEEEGDPDDVESEPEEPGEPGEEAEGPASDVGGGSFVLREEERDGIPVVDEVLPMAQAYGAPPEPPEE